MQARAKLVAVGANGTERCDKQGIHDERDGIESSQAELTQSDSGEDEPDRARRSDADQELAILTKERNDDTADQTDEAAGDENSAQVRNIATQ